MSKIFLKLRKYQQVSSGISLLWLLFLIAAIGILYTFVLKDIIIPQNQARDATRREDLKKLKEALTRYYNSYGEYPSTINSGCKFFLPGRSPAPWCSELTEQNYIPNQHDFVPVYIDKLPSDPAAGKDPPDTLYGCPCSNYFTSYAYTSNGRDFKLIAFCTPEQAMNNTQDEFYDPVRPSCAWQISSDRSYDRW